MDVWADPNKNLKDELLNSDDVKKYLSVEEISGIFNDKKMLKNVDYIFSRTIYKED
jgi:adenylosuccinate lyase